MGTREDAIMAAKAGYLSTAEANMEMNKANIDFSGARKVLNRRSRRIVPNDSPSAIRSQLATYLAKMKQKKAQGEVLTPSEKEELQKRMNRYEGTLNK